jgi:DNA mismatch repair protein MutL
MKIKILSDETINKIAAGEVIERPSSVVKELVENSLDAGATEITVEINDGGKNLIRVTDNGSGMDKEDAALAFERHATSKIRSADDLFNIASLGFRGEALPSIAGISKVELVTRTKEMDYAVKIRIDGGKLLEVKETGAPQGTVINVKNLFFNTPARRKFLKSNTTEISHIVDIVSQYSLIYAKCSFKLISNDETLIEIFSRDTLLDRIRVLYGNDAADNALELKKVAEGITIKGYTCTPAVTYPTRSYQLVFVNNRPIVNRAISYSIFDAYSSLIPKGKFPAIFLFIQISPETIDVNVHPTKKEIKFSDDKLIQSIVKSAILDCLNITPANAECQTSNKDFPYNSDQKYSTETAANVMPFNNPQNSWKIQEMAPFMEFSVNNKLIQMHNAYILNESEDGIELIDQHAVHERIIYEKIKESLTAKNPDGQRLLIPINIELTAAEEKIIKEKLNFFCDIGFNIEEFGPRTYIVDMIPSFMDKVDIVKFIKDIANEIRENEKAVSQENIKDDIIKMVACRSAIMQGDKLDISQMQNLIKEWKNLKFPYTCPHGRPAVIKITKKELEKKFQRS